ncbi:ImpA family type VI secretion system protein [Citrobacter farmeri]
MDAFLSEPVSAEFPCGPDLEYDPEYLLLFTRATPRAEAQYGDFISSPETINWAELERDARRLLLRSRDIRVLIVLLRCRIQQAGGQGLAEALTLLENQCFSNPDAIHPQLLPAEDPLAEDAVVARSNALSALLDPEGVMADIRSIALSNNAAMRLQVRDVERALSAPRPADALAPESVRQQLADLDLEARGALPLEAFRRSMEIIEHLQQWSQETLHDLAPDFSRLRQLLSLLPGAVQTTTPELPLPETQAVQQEPAIIKNVEPASADTAHPLVNIPAGISTKDSANSGQIRDRNDALAHLRLIRHWFESTEPSSPTIPLLRQAERLVGKRFSEVINEIPTELLKKWDTQE